MAWILGLGQAIPHMLLLSAMCTMLIRLPGLKSVSMLSCPAFITKAWRSV